MMYPLIPVEVSGAEAEVGCRQSQAQPGSPPRVFHAPRVNNNSARSVLDHGNRPHRIH
jgi:hypothetical protein